MMYIREEVHSAKIMPGFGWLGNRTTVWKEAEAQRLKVEMKKLVLRAEAAVAADPFQTKEPFWQGVEKLYQEWSKLKAEADLEVYGIAATAAGRLGCGTVRYLRLMKALAAGDLRPAVAGDKKWLESHFAHVDIRLRRNAKGDLQAKGSLLGAEARNVFLRAQKELKAKGKFDDLLPAIAFTIDGHAVSLGPEFAISSGVSVVNIDQKGDGSFKIEPKPGPFKYLRARDECPV